MPLAYASAVFAADVDQAWTLVRDFNGLPAWHPAIASSTLDGAEPATVGAVRTLTMPDGGVVREQLIAVDEPDRSYTYDILTSPFAVRSYRSTIRLRPITTTGHTFAEWYVHFDADAADEQALTRTFADDVFAAGLAALGAHLGQ